MRRAWTLMRALSGRRRLIPMAAATLIFLTMTILLLRAGGSAVPIPSFAAVRAAYRPSDRLLLDQDGVPLYQLRINHGRRQLAWTPLAELAPTFTSHLIAAEDHRFASHHGVDWLAAGAAAWQTLRGHPGRGASTITMQLASWLEPGAAMPPRRRSLRQKMRQVQRALALEQVWTKQEILEAYVNIVGYRGELVGIRAAAWSLFAKTPLNLSADEAALLVAMLRGGAARSTELQQRACHVRHRLAPEAECRLAAMEALGRASIPQPASLAGPLARLLLRDAGPDVRSTIERGVQMAAAEALREQLRQLSGQNVHDGAVLVIENRTGAVLAYVGNGGDLASASYVDGIRAERQAGSTLKPFLYALAFEQSRLTPASLLNDEPVNLPVTGGMYRPANYEHAYYGTVTARTALGSSLNIPAIRVLLLAGEAALKERLHTLHILHGREQPDFGPSLALGTADVTLWDLTNAYRALANGGAWTPAKLIDSPDGVPETRVFSPGAAFLVADILADRAARSLTFGLENSLSTRFWSAVKTGTSKDMRDNWAVGFSRDCTVGVWVGNFSGEPMWNVSGVTGAAPIWTTVMNYLHVHRQGHAVGLPNDAPPVPSGVVASTMAGDEHLGIRDREYFIEGTEMTRSRLAIRHRPVKITYPVEGMVIAIDPDIPAARQRLFFAAQGGGRLARWTLDGQDLGSTEQQARWEPKAGRHVLAVRSGGHDLDSVRFLVKR